MIGRNADSVEPNLLIVEYVKQGNIRWELGSGELRHESAFG
jgi:hypothetical protein